MSTPERFLDLCDDAMCAPDFSVTQNLSRTNEAEWLCARLAREGHTVPLEEVQAAIDAWDNRPRGREHHVGTLKL